MAADDDQAKTANDEPGADEAGDVARSTYRVARRIAVTVVGSAVLLVGIVFLVTPGPAFVVIPAGLGILATEFGWAKRWLHRVRAMAKSGVRAIKPDR